MKKLTIVIAAAAIIMILIAAGVAIIATGGGQTTAGTSGSASTGGQAGQKGGILTMLGADPPTLDPALVQDATSSEYVVEIFSGLVTLNDKLDVVPDIAEKWDVSPDGKSYTFHLRQGVKFQSGKELTANDFKYSLERAADPKTLSPVADSYLGDIVGVRDKLAGKAREISGVKVVGPSTLQIDIDAPKIYFLSKLTYPTAFVVDKDNVSTGQNWTQHPNGTGPFKLKEYKVGDRITLERNDNYYRGVANLDQVVFMLAGGSSMTMYENGEVDVTGVGLTDIERVLDPKDPLNKELIKGETLDIGYIGFNTTMPPFDDVKVRQAFNYAVDKTSVVKAVLQDLVEPAQGILPPGLEGYNKDLKGIPYDLNKAKSLIAESKYKSVSNFPPITVTIAGTGASLPPTSEAITKMWKDNLGVDVQIQQVEWATFLQDLKRHRFQVFEGGWIADYPDPQNFLDILFHSNSLDNSTGYSNPQVDQLIEKARTEKDRNTRIKDYQDAEQLIVNDAPWLPLWHGTSYLLVKPYVKGYSIHPTVIPFLKDVSVTKKK